MCKGIMKSFFWFTPSVEVDGDRLISLRRVF